MYYILLSKKKFIIIIVQNIFLFLFYFLFILLYFPIHLLERESYYNINFWMKNYNFKKQII